MMRCAVSAAGVVLVGLAIRIWLASLGETYDMASYRIVADAVAHGRNVYAATDRYNYGPIWAGVLWGAQQFSAASFHRTLALTLAGADLALADWLWRRYGGIAALVFWLSPVGCLVTGYYSQFDALAIALGAWAWVALSVGAVPVAATLAGLSLSTKHVLCVFPLWVLMMGRLPVRQRLQFAVIAYGLFIALFVPFVWAPGAWAAIQHNVIHYRSKGGNGLVSQVLAGLATTAGLEVDILPAAIALWLAALLVVAWVVQRRHLDPLPIYCVAFVAFSPSMAGQYLAIPLIAVGAYWRRWQVWFYTAVACLMLIERQFAEGTLWFYPPYFAAQACLCLLLADLCRSAPEARRAVVLPERTVLA